MALFPFLRKKSAKVSTEYFYPMSFQGSLNMKTGTRIDTKTTSGQLNAYVNCPPVATLITSKVTAANNAKWYFGDEAGNVRSNQTIRQIQDLFEKPNNYQDWKRFFAMAYQMNQLFGKAYIWVHKPVGLARRYATSMEVIPNQYISPVKNATDDLVYKYKYTYNGKVSYIDAEEFMIWNDFTIDLQSSTNYHEGQSRLYSCSDPINTVIAAYEANNVLLTSYGMMSIISPDPANNVQGVVIPMNDEQKTNVQDDIVKRYGLMRDQYPFLVTGQPIKITNVGRPIKDLALQETIQDSTRVLSEAYKYPFHLLGFTSGTTYSNVAESEKRLYVDAIIPEVQGFIDTFNIYFDNNSDMQLRFSFDHLPPLQANRLENEQALQTATNRIISALNAEIYTINEAKDLLSNLE